MLVVFADKIPDRIRGQMKLWFIEPIPTCFVSSVSDALAVEVAEKLYELCDDDSSMLIVRSINLDISSGLGAPISDAELRIDLI